MRIGFVGAVEGSRIALDALIASDLAPVLVVTLPPEAAGRHSDFADLAGPAREAGAALHFTSNVNAPETIQALGEARLDLLAVVGWSQICRAPFREAARLGAIGYHPAPLPRFRGRAVIPWTILCGEKETGSTVFWLDEGTDSGPILAQMLFPVAPDETARSLYDKHTRALCELMPQAVRAVAEGASVARVQDHARASWCARRTPDDGLIDWREPAERVLTLIRAVGDPYPGAFTFSGSERLAVAAARPFAPAGRFIGLVGQVQTHTPDGFTVLCGDGAAIEIVQATGSGAKPKVHARLGSA